jgi:hypothetical protein
MRERDVEAAVCMFAAGVGVGTYKLAGPNDRGKPDRLFFKDGKAIFIELKASGEEPTDLQLRNIRKLREKGMFADWTDSPRVASQWILDHLIP